MPGSAARWRSRLARTRCDTTPATPVTSTGRSVPTLRADNAMSDNPPTPNPSPTGGGGEPESLAPPSPLVGEGGRGGEGHSRIAVFGGVYNNYLALEAALHDVRRRGVDACYCLGAP